MPQESMVQLASMRGPSDCTPKPFWCMSQFRISGWAVEPVCATESHEVTTTRSMTGAPLRIVSPCPHSSKRERLSVSCCPRAAE